MGKWFFRTSPADVAVGSAFSNKQNCLKSRSARKAQYACFESEFSPGKAFLGEIKEKEAIMFGPPYASLADCVESLSNSDSVVTCGESAYTKGTWFLYELGARKWIGSGYKSKQDCFDSI